MHQLTIDLGDTKRTVPYDDFEAAHRMLMSHVVAEDLYLHTDWSSPQPGTTFKLLKVDQDCTRPRVVGTATIALAPAKPVDAPYYSAQEALRWIADHEAVWMFGADNDPGVRYPLAVLTAARAEARGWFSAGAIYTEAASLAGVDIDEVPRPRQVTLEVLRDHAIAAGRREHPLNAADLATEVQRHLTADVTPQQTAALIWWAALLIWGVNAP
jgi:hypothetical protein